MPLYEYACPACGKKFNDLVPFSEADDPMPCVGCGEPAVRLLSRLGRIMFSDPRGTSLADNIEYVGGWNAENAKDIRRRAEKAQEFRYNDLPLDYNEGVRDARPDELPGVDGGNFDIPGLEG